MIFVSPRKAFGSRISTQVAFFEWTAALGKFLTIDNLRKRKVWILDWCYLCKYNGESVNHLFFHCLVAMDLWSMVLGLFGVSWVMPQSIVGLLACWQGKLWHQNGHIWLLVPHCLMWCLWKERNSRCFEDNERSITNLKLIFFRTLLDWLSALWNQSFSSFLDFLDSCNFCTWFVGLGGPFFDINKTYYLSKKRIDCTSLLVHRHVRSLLFCFF